MSLSRTTTGVVFLGPRSDAEGGVATVLKNYRRMAFWSTFRCRHLPTMTDASRPVPKVVYEIYRLGATLAALATAPRPAAASIHCSHGMGFYRETLHLLLLRLFRVPVVLHVHPSAFSDFYRLGGRFRKFFVRLAFRHSDKAVFLSESTRQEFRELIPGTDSCCLANPVDVGQYQTGGSGNAKTPSHVLFMGWIIREKGVYDLLDAVPLVLEKYPDARFTFAGNKEVERLRNLIESRGLSAVAEVPGWVTGEKRLALLRSATVLVLPSYTEGLPNVILEAMASGLPVIATGVGAIPDVVKHRETGLLVRPGDVAGIASAIHTALADPELRHHMSESALRLVESRYSLEAVSAALTAIYSRYLPARLSRNGHTHHSGNDR